MTRKKVKLMWIVNDSARKASLKKRRIGLLKKVSELTTLCGVSAFVIIYSPEEKEPMLWPSRQVVQQMLMRYQSIPEIERSKKMMNQESYLKERIAKLQEQLRKHQKKNREIELTYFMDRLHHGNGMDDLEVNEVQEFIWLLEEKMKDVRKRVEYFQQAPALPAGFFPLASHGGPTIEAMGHQEGGSSGAGDIMRNSPIDGMLWDQWFIDMMNNNENIAGGGTRDDTCHPLGFNINETPGAGGVDLRFVHVHPGNFGGTGDGNMIEQGLPQGNMNMAVNPYDLGFFPHGNPIGGNPFGMELKLHDNVTGGVELPAPPSSTTGGRSDVGLPGFFTSGSDIGLPYDVTKPWPHNLSP
ncbi:agamous-like MADS-box protein AGL80 [Manihot esculenta]|uniref:MADS-box domain-containing protein n=1 Tax=Manihot esculenta TaxID=3983 RepID=A0A2C9VD47_MANES|nr:agamous-like MADS-box protein AGL80 [Manihot esculenta]OAY43012.1 hypothetical protein MANES_08G035100v8 [Manihot esculenta]